MKDPTELRRKPPSTTTRMQVEIVHRYCRRFIRSASIQPRRMIRDLRGQRKPSRAHTKTLRPCVPSSSSSMNNGGGLYCVEAIEHPASRKGAASSMAKIIVIPEDSQLVAAGTPGRSRTRVCEVFCGSRDGLALEPVHATSNYAHDAPRQTEDDERSKPFQSKISSMSPICPGKSR